MRTLVRDLGNAAGSRQATSVETAHLREFFARRVLHMEVDDYILRKYRRHVQDDLHWPEDTTPEEYLESLRATILDPGSRIYLTIEHDRYEWTICFVGPVRRAWRGPDGSDRIAVLFNGERHFFITGFQPTSSDAYIDRQGGFWRQQR